MVHASYWNHPPYAYIILHCPLLFPQVIIWFLQAILLLVTGFKKPNHCAVLKYLDRVDVLNNFLYQSFGMWWFPVFMISKKTVIHIWWITWTLTSSHKSLPFQLFLSQEWLDKVTPVCLSMGTCHRAHDWTCGHLYHQEYVIQMWQTQVLISPHCVTVYHITRSHIHSLLCTQQLGLHPEKKDTVLTSRASHLSMGLILHKNVGFNRKWAKNTQL